MKRSFIAIAATVAAIGAITACSSGGSGSSGTSGGSADQASVVTVKTATGNMASGLNAPYFVALAKGYFKAQGIDSSLIELSGSTSSTSMVSGAVQINYSGSSAANAAVQGLPVKVVASISNVSSSLIYTADSDVHTLADIQGKTFGIQSLGDSYQEAAELAFTAAGVDASKVQFVPLGAGNRTKAIASGRVAAGALKQSEATELIQQGYKLRLLYSLPAHGIAQSTGGVATSSSFITSDDATLERYLYAWVQGVRYCQEFPSQAAAITLAAPQMKATGMSQADLVASIKQFYIDEAVPADLSIPADVQTKLLDAKEKFLPNVKSGVTTADVYDFSPIQQAISKLNASGWKPAQ